MQTTRNVKIIGTGIYLPKRQITADEVDRMIGTAPGWVLRKSDVAVRYFAEDETAAQMGAYAVKNALNDAGLAFADIDCLVCTSGTMEQPIPCTAALIQKALGESESGTPAFDINSTCLSFVVGLDTMSYLVHAGRYRRIVLVATEIASRGLNWNDKESAALFGDGAAAVVIERSGEEDRSRIVHAALHTVSKGAHMSEIRGGGSKLPARSFREDNKQDFLFHMDGHAIFKLASKILPGFTGSLLEQAGCRMADIKLVIPHQGSAMAMRLLSRKLGIAEEQLMYITPEYGNTIAASIPMGLHEAAKQGRIGRGDRVMLLGTSAGVSVGGLIFDY
ncbi:beta-ketoacyl-ACP synthase III [Paenibacillus sp. MBLB4367]|uniref:beta-ketoacyl-ACP synthase III n=1 Tax=Paenibacillus sp. MBLB4367 TaxID=3384767 RepID=UPI00390828C9